MQLKGLSEKEVLELRKKYGWNILKEEKESALKRFLKKFIGPIPLMIETALILSAITKHWEDFVIIGVLLAVNILVDFWQEQKAVSALEDLKKLMSPKAVILRDGQVKEIDAKELVPGDIVKLTIGDIVPADVELINEEILQINQAAITGESLAVEKNLGDKIFAASVVEKGNAWVKVIATGKNSSLGKNAELVKKAEENEESHFQKAIFRIAKFLIIVASVLIVITFVYLIHKGDPFLETLSFALVLAVASIPVALPAVLSVTMAIGANTLARKNTIVSNFKAIEELAGVSHLCIDKTGTITKNELSILKPETFGNFSLKDLFNFGLLVSNSEKPDPIEKSILKYAKEHKFDNISNFEILEKNPFDPVSKKSEVLIEKDGNKIKVVMGAPQVIQKMISNDLEKNKYSEKIKKLAENGLRTVSLGIVKNDRFYLVGIFPILDPPREDSKKVLAEIQKKGVVVKMITGDNSLIAKFVAKLLNLDPKNVYAEAVPEDKFKIVEDLQKKGYIVAMTGDGVNDAPALKKADIGIAVAGASPAARSAADLILLDKGLAVISVAIDESRKTFERMRSYATFRISETIRVIFFISLSVLIFNYSPLNATMIILLALLNDIPVMAIAYDNAPVAEKPIRWDLKELLFVATVLGLTGLISSFLLFWYLNISGFALAIIYTIIFLKLDVSGHSTLYLTRTGDKHFWEKPWPSLKFFLPAFGSRIIGTILALFGILMTAISWKWILIIWLYSTIWFLINDWVKVWAFKFYRKFLK